MAKWIKLNLKSWILLLVGFVSLSLVGKLTYNKSSSITKFEIGQAIDSLNGTFVYYNGTISNISGRNTTKDGYNLGLKYQCVEFVKRYYYEQLNHKMPNSYGNAKDFFDISLKDGSKNKQRGLIQFTNPSQTKPKAEDLLIYRATLFNKFGHVAIISKVSESEIEIIQQNPVPSGKSREVFKLENKAGKWEISNDRILGWLRME